MKRRSFFAIALILLLITISGCQDHGGIKIPDTNQVAPIYNSKVNIQKYVLNEASLIETSSGNYNLTFVGARYPTTEWQNLTSTHDSIFLDYTYSNIDFQKSDGTILYIPHEAFIVTDQNGVILNGDSMHDVTRLPAEAPPGTTCAASLPYIVNSNVTEINVKFKSGTTGEIIGEINNIPVTHPE